MPIVCYMISSTSLTAFSGATTTAPLSSPDAVRLVRDAGPSSAQAAPAPRPLQPGLAPPGSTPRGSLLNLQV